MHEYDVLTHLLYIARWGILAIPGAWFYSRVQRVVPGNYKPMLISQVILGSVVFFLDAFIYYR